MKAYEKAILVLFKRFTRKVLADLSGTKALESPAVPPPNINLQKFNQLLYDNTLAELLNPAENTINVRIPEAYKAGNLFASIRLGAPYEIRKDEWKKIAVLVEGNKTAFKAVTDATAGKISAAVAHGIIKEYSLSEISRDIVRAVDGVGIVRATAMVRTEVMKAVNQGVIDRYKAAGVDKVEWLSVANDPWPCGECSSYDGKTFPIDSHPDIPVHPNCCCTLLPVIDIPETED